MRFRRIRHHVLLLCMSFLTTKEWIPFCVASDNIMHPARLFPSGMSFRTTKERRQHHASGTVISFWDVFSDYKGGDDIFTCIRHHLLFLCMSFLTTKEWIPFCVASDNIMHPALSFPSGMSFLTTKEVMTFSLASATIFCCLYVFSDYKREDPIFFGIRQHHVLFCTSVLAKPPGRSAHVASAKNISRVGC